MTRYFKSTLSDLRFKFSPAGSFVGTAKYSWKESSITLDRMNHNAVETDSTGEPLKQLVTGAAITPAFLDGYAAVLDSCRSTVRRVRLESEAGDMTADEAASVVRETVKTITEFCQV